MIRKEIRVRDRLRKTYRRTNRQTDLTKYRNQRNKVNNLKKKLKEKYFENMNESLDGLKNTDSKSYWKMIRALVKGSKPSHNIPTLTYNGNVAFDDDDKCDMFNNYFCSVTDIDDDNHELPDLDNRTDITFSDVHIDPEDIVDIISTLDPGKASGPDDFSHKLLQGICPEIVRPLLILFNKSLQYGKFPKPWKHAHVIPIYKKGENSSPTNYRPISLLSCIGKLFERVVFKYLYNHLHDHHLLYNLQAGFRPGQSTVTQLIEIYHHICVALDNKQLACFTFCDISKAFDRVWLRGLIYKLEKYGFRGNLLAWLTDYLTDRTQQVKLKSSISIVGRNKAGVPQGSVLGPLLFLIFINDLPDGLRGLTRLFADDTSNSHVSRDLEEIQRTNNDDLKLINDWGEKWLVDFNPQKTKCVIFGASDAQLETTVFDFNGSPIEPSLTHRHLGIVFSCNAKWTAHIDSICDRVSKQIAVLRKLKYTLNRDFLSRIYLTFIRPLFEYASEVWDNLTLADSDRLEKFQLETARIVTGLPSYCSRAALYFETGWDTLKTRREHKKLCLMYKMVNNTAPNYLCELLPPRVGENTMYNLRNTDDFTLPYCRLNLLKNSFIPQTLSEWNKLPADIKNAPTLNQFKSKLKQRVTAPRSAYFSHGKRKLNIWHTQLRHGYSKLNDDLFKVNLSQTRECPCGFSRESAIHFFTQCPLYNDIRQELELSLLRVNARPDIGTLLYGDSDLPLQVNIKIFTAVQKYIQDSNRFS